jgi:biotin transport system substrate-specific component
MSNVFTLSKPNETLSQDRAWSLLQVFGASLFLALCTQITIPLFFSPVPISLQTFAVLMIGGMLGPKKGAASVLLYLVEGSLGLPFFVQGKAGILTFLGPTGGYLVGFVVQAYLVGWFLQQKSNLTSGKLLAVLLFSCLIQMSLGVLWLSHLVGWSRVWIMGFYPFVPGEILKSVAAAKSLALLKKYE